jgi:exocyst complex component 8
MPHIDLAQLVADGTEEEIRQYKQGLQKFRNRTSTDLQANVYQNRSQFVKISKEAEKLKVDMRALRSLMSELKTNTNALYQATAKYGTGSVDSSDMTESSSARARKQANRSSFADLTVIYNTQLSTLWKDVEGSQKFLPIIPGRHVIRDSPQWVELNSATWKSIRAMRLFLLNDHLLIASRKKKRVDPSQNGSNQSRQPATSKLVAERCWPLQDIEVVDLSRSSNTAGAKTEDVKNAISIRVGQESFTYRNDKGTDEKMGFLLAYKKGVEELRKTIRAENENDVKTKDSITYLTARDPDLLKKGDLLENLSESMGKDRPSILIDVDGKQQNLRWVESQMDELDVAVALQSFDDAVDRVESLRRIAKGLKSNGVAQDLINFKVDQRAAKLAGLVTAKLIDRNGGPDATTRNVEMLTRLGFEDRAREAYLEARSGVIRKRTRCVCLYPDDSDVY